jgi:hypothetical protein
MVRNRMGDLVKITLQCFLKGQGLMHDGLNRLPLWSNSGFCKHSDRLLGSLRTEERNSLTKAVIVNCSTRSLLFGIPMCHPY